MKENKRTIGSEQEEFACKFLQSKGYVILRRNFQCKFGEIDIIAKDIAGEVPVLCFVEVKYRNNLIHGLPEEAVDRRKQQRISRTAMYYLSSQVRQLEVDCRFDVIALQRGEPKLIKNAFEAVMS